MSGPNPPEPGPELDGAGNGQSAADSVAGKAGAGDGGDAVSAAYSQAYSAPESEQFLSGPYVPVDPRLYDYDSYDVADEPDSHTKAPRWPWVVGVTVIVAAISLVVSVALLFARTETQDLATPATTASATNTVLLPPVQDEITTTRTTTTTTTTPPPPPTSEEPPPPPPTTESPAPAPAPVETPAPEPSTTATTTTAARPLQVTYSVTGTKAPFDQITITYVDSSGQRRTQRNAYIPWSLTLTPISQSEVGSVEASSMLRLSKLNCSITSSDGRVLSANSNDAPQTVC